MARVKRISAPGGNAAGRNQTNIEVGRQDGDRSNVEIHGDVTIHTVLPSTETREQEARVRALVAEEQAFRRETKLDHGPRQRAAFIRAAERYDLSMRKLAYVERKGYARYIASADTYMPRHKPTEARITRALAILCFAMLVICASAGMWFAKNHIATATTLWILSAFLGWVLANLAHENMRPNAIAAKMTQSDESLRDRGRRCVE